MKQLLITALVFCAAASAAQPPSGKAKPGSTYGAKVDPSNAMSASELPSKLNDKDTIPVKVKGRVLEVCKQKGCWMTMKLNDSTEAFVKMKDYAFFLPLDIKNKNIVLEGIAFVKTTTAAELKHYAEDAKKPQAEVDAITKDEKQIRLLASGIVVTE